MVARHHQATQCAATVQQRLAPPAVALLCCRRVCPCSTLAISQPRSHGLKQGCLVQVQQSKDPEGLRAFYYLVQVRPHS